MRTLRPTLCCQRRSRPLQDALHKKFCLPSARKAQPIRCHAPLEPCFSCHDLHFPACSFPATTLLQHRNRPIPPPTQPPLRARFERQLSSHLLYAISPHPSQSHMAPPVPRHAESNAGHCAKSASAHHACKTGRAWRWAPTSPCTYLVLASIESLALDCVAVNNVLGMLAPEKSEILELRVG